jgi:hypothetical protein
MGFLPGWPRNITFSMAALKSSDQDSLRARSASRPADSRKVVPSTPGQMSDLTVRSRASVFGRSPGHLYLPDPKAVS